MKKKLNLIIVFVLFASYIYFAFAIVDNSVGSYLFKDNATFDRTGHAIAQGDNLTLHGWFYKDDATNGPTDTGTYSSFAGQAIINLSMSSAYAEVLSEGGVNWSNTTDNTSTNASSAS